LAPLFPFGHGLSYTSFEYADLRTSTVSNDGAFTVSFRITNTGNTAGSEAALIFISDSQASLPRPEKELKGFAKVALNPGESKELNIQLDRDALSFWEDRRAKWVAEKGKFTVLVAASAEDVRLRSEIELAQDIEWLGL
jgi:beta-glucosidase